MATYTLLIVDDEPHLRLSLAQIFQREGYLVTTAAQAEEARQYLEAGAFDLTLLDLKLPKADGLSLLAEMHARYPEMPIFILTAHATLESAIEAIRCGARDYLRKPVSPETLLARVHAILAVESLPRRRREIEAKLQNLMAELHHLDDERMLPLTHSPAPAFEPARYLRRNRLTLDLHTHQAWLEERPIALPTATFAYLVTLLRHSPEAVSYETLVKESQGYQVLPLEACEITRGPIHELRKALEDDIRQPQYIITIRDFGYRLIT